MVQAAKCKVCGVAHFGMAHVWPKGDPLNVQTPRAPPKAVPAPKDDRDAVIAALQAKVTALEAEVATLRRDAAQAVARRKRQRDLMRKRRAK